MSETNETVINNKPKIMFLEYGSWGKNQHLISVLVRIPGVKQGVAARIYRVYDPEKQVGIYTAKDGEGKILGTPTEKLFELKKELKELTPQLAESLMQEKKSRTKETPEEKLAEKDNPDLEEELTEEETGKKKEEVKNLREEKTVSKGQDLGR